MLQAGSSTSFHSISLAVTDDPSRPVQSRPFRVRWLPDADPAASNLSQRSPFALVSLDAGEQAMPNAAILLTRAAGGAGYHLLYSLAGISAEGLIDFSGPCDLRPPVQRR